MGRLPNLTGADDNCLDPVVSSGRLEETVLVGSNISGITLG